MSTLVNEAYEAYHDQLQGYLTSLTHDREVAQDIAQETFARLLREERADRAPQHTRAWLFQVSRNLVTSRGRRLQVAERSKDRLRTETVDASAEEACLRRETSSELHALLDRLDERDRTALLMAAEGYSAAEIASVIGRSPNAVRTRICRARATLRGQWHQPADSLRRSRPCTGR
jgi:RNA polymerase sigma-70 factor, ECF subfamily